MLKQLWFCYLTIPGMLIETKADFVDKITYRLGHLTVILLYQKQLTFSKPTLNVEPEHITSNLPTVL